ncbi:hypothetical protein IJT93_11920 [bacterium]|nr:hypothetical protein [bacterium]
MSKTKIDEDNIIITEEIPASFSSPADTAEKRQAETADIAQPEAKAETEPSSADTDSLAAEEEPSPKPAPANDETGGEASDAEKESALKKPHILLTSDKISLLLAIMLAAAMLLGTSTSMILWSTYWESQTVHPAINPGPFDNRIIPGFRAGFITIGMNSAFLEPNLGTCTMRPQKDGLICLFQDRMLNVSVTNNRVSSVFITNPGFVIQLQNDANQDQTSFIHVGSDIDLVLRTFGSNYDSSQSSSVADKDVNNEKYVLHYWAQGIHFGAYQHKVTHIMITESILEDSDLVVRNYPQPLHGQ